MEKRRLVPVVVLTMIVFLSFSLTLLPVLATHGSYPGVNGKIVFDGYPPNQPQTMYVMNPDGTDVKELALPPSQPLKVADHYAGVWSPDGSKIAFSYEPLENNVWIMDADGSNWIQLTRYGPVLDTGDAAWSPDGSKIAFYTRGLEIHVVPSVPVPDPWIPPPDLTMGQSPHWSPDGTKILFHRNGIGGYQDGIYLMNPDGSDVELLVKDAYDPCWSPDGSKIVFSSGAGIWVMSAADGTVLDQLTDNAADIQPNWSPDGTKIVFTRGERWDGLSSIYVVNADGSGTPTELTPWARNEGWNGVRRPDWQRLPAAVGGFMEPVSTFAIFAPWLAAMGLVGCMATVVVVVRKRFDS